MDNKLEEIRKRDELYDGQFTTIVYSDRRWLLGEVERLRAALQSIENFTISPYHPAILARRALAGEEE